MNSPDQPFWDSVETIRDADPRFSREAYGFLMGALGLTVQALPAARREDAARRHLSGQELLSGLIQLARSEFGSLAPMVFREWGVRRGEDWGTIVFQLVATGQLSARPEDRVEDFAGGPDLETALTDGLDGGSFTPPAPDDRPRRGDSESDV